MPWKFVNKHAFSKAHGRGEKHLSKLLLEKTKLKSPSNGLFYIRDRGQPPFPFNCSKNMKLDFAMALACQFQLAPFIFSQSHTSNSTFNILIDSMYEVSLADIMINKQKGFIVGCGGHGRTANFATPAARKSIFGIFVGHLG
jgi:hypothetical protein